MNRHLNTDKICKDNSATKYKYIFVLIKLLCPNLCVAASFEVSITYLPLKICAEESQIELVYL